MRIPAPMATSSCVSSDDRLVTRDIIVQGGSAITDTSEAENKEQMRTSSGLT